MADRQTILMRRRALGISVPPRVQVEAVFTWYAYELEPQEVTVLAFSQESGWGVDPAHGPLSMDRETGRERARIIATHFGYLPEWFQPILAGAVGTPESMEWVNKHYSDIQSEIVSERYGAGSWIQEFVKGQVSTADCQHLLRDWALSVRQLGIVPENETPEQRNTRRTNRVTYAQAMAELVTLWDTAYTTAKRNTDSKIHHATGEERILLTRASELYQSKIGNSPRPAMDFNTLRTTAQIDSARTQPLAARSKTMRIVYWRTMFGPDHLASHLAHSRDIVDIPKLRLRPVGDDTPAYPSMLKNRFAHTCDIIHKKIIGYEDTVERIHVLAPNVDLRHTSSPWKPNYKDAYKLIRGLYTALGQSGDWKNIPVKMKNGRKQRVSKHRAPIRLEPDVVEDREETI